MILLIIFDKVRTMEHTLQILTPEAHSFFFFSRRFDDDAHLLFSFSFAYHVISFLF